MTSAVSRIAKAVVRLAWPVLVAQLAVIASGVLDTVMAGRYSSVDLAAVGIGASVYFSVFIGLMGVVQALSPIAAQLFGGKQYERIGEETRQTAWLALGLAVLGVLLLAFPDPFLRLASAPPEVEARTRAYLQGIAWALPAMLLKIDNNIAPVATITIDVAFASRLPSLARLPSTVMRSSAFIESRFHPKRSSAFGPPISSAQFTTAPVCSSGTSMYIKMCGLVHSTFVTLPVNVIGFDTSYCTGNEWCAYAGSAAASTLAVSESKAVLKVVFMRRPGFVCYAASRRGCDCAQGSRCCWPGLTR